MPPEREMDKDLEVKKPPQVAMQRGPGAGIAPGEKPKDLMGSLKQLFSYMGKYRLLLLVVLVFAVGGTVFQVVGPKVMGMATTEIANGLAAKKNGTGGMDYGAIGRILMITVALYFAGSVMTALQARIMAVITQKLGYSMRRDISEKINRMPMSYFESRSYGEVLSRITNDVDTFTQSLAQSVSMLVTSVTILMGTIVMMLIISPQVSLVALVVLPVSALVVHLIVMVSQKHFKTQQEYLGVLNGKVEETYSGQQVIKAFGKEESMVEEFDRENGVLYESAWKSQFLSGLMQPVMFLVTNIGYVGVAVAGGYFAIRGVIGIGDIQAFIQYIKNLNQPMQQIAQVMNQIQSMSAAVERVFEFLGEEEEDQGPVTQADISRGSADGESAESANEQTDGCRESLTDEGAESQAAETSPEGNEAPCAGGLCKGAVSFEHVRFGYDKEHVIIKDFSAEVDPGQKIAIVGPTGAGKTTIVKLLMRFYDVDSGRITLDRKDIRDYGRRELRKNFGMVLQETWLYSASIKDNIRYGKPDATMEEVVKAAKAAHIHHFIKALPGGYDMVLNEDATNISQGQKQLITIARAILADNRVLILDEATSSVDTRTEELIQKAMDNLMEGRTSFVIAHRLSTIKNADLILVMDHGDIIEQGTHGELLKKGGFYAGLYNSQFES